MIKTIITGATGMIGKGVLLECLDQYDISEVLVLSRRETGINHPKLKEIIHSDFSDFKGIEDQLQGFDACFYCLGVSAGGIKKEQYKRITYDFTMALARTLHSINPDMVFNYVSGEGTDSTEKGRLMWARVKGKTENQILKMEFRQAYMFRPGLIIPLKGIRSSTKAYQFIYDYFMWLIKIIKRIWPKSVVSTSQIGMAMIHSVLKRYDKSILRPRDIIDLSEKE